MAADQQVQDVERFGAAFRGLLEQLLETFEPAGADDALVALADVAPEMVVNTVLGEPELCRDSRELALAA